jgi:hypothetical protein
LTLNSSHAIQMSSYVFFLELLIIDYNEHFYSRMDGED